jgi:starvation-inducible DNA-binding protein
MAATVLKAKVNTEDLSTGIDQKSRNEISAGLVEVLASTYTLLIKTHVYHWNVVGALFLPLHELTDAQYNDMFAAVDALAERIRALGLPTPLSFEDFDERSAIKEETQDRTAEGMVAQLVKDHEKLSRRMREIAQIADEGKDLVTVDLLTQRLTFHEKAIWMLRATVAK